MCNGVVFEVLAELAKKKEAAYKKGEEGLAQAQEIDAVEAHVKRMIKPKPLDQLFLTEDEQAPENPPEMPDEGSAGFPDLSKVGA